MNITVTERKRFGYVDPRTGKDITMELLEASGENPIVLGLISKDCYDRWCEWFDVLERGDRELWELEVWCHESEKESFKSAYRLAVEMYPLDYTDTTGLERALEDRRELIVREMGW